MEIIEKLVATPGEVYKPSSPFLAEVIETRRLTPAGSADDIRHIVLSIKGSKIQYMEGQSVGIVAPGLREDGKPQKVRLYSIASARCGELGCDLGGHPESVTLCVKRVIYTDPETGKEVRGLASNHLCDAKLGQKLQLTGPTGRKFLLPADDSVPLIMIAAGTGIAPFRAFIKHIYHEKGGWNGSVKLFYGAKTGLETLYMNDESNDIGQYYTEETFAAFKALSRASNQPKTYVQDKIAAQRDQLWPLISTGRFCLYICGLKGIEEGVSKVMSAWAKEEGKDWEQLKEEFEKSGRWNVEVY